MGRPFCAAPVDRILARRLPCETVTYDEACEKCHEGTMLCRELGPQIHRYSGFGLAASVWGELAWQGQVTQTRHRRDERASLCNEPSASDARP